LSFLASCQICAVHAGHHVVSTTRLGAGHLPTLGTLAKFFRRHSQELRSLRNVHGSHDAATSLSAGLPTRIEGSIRRHLLDLSHPRERDSARPRYSFANQFSSMNLPSDPALH